MWEQLQESIFIKILFYWIIAIPFIYLILKVGCNNKFILACIIDFIKCDNEDYKEKRDEIINNCEKEIRNGLKMHYDYNEEVANEWLKHLYSSYLERFMSDNNQIWKMAQILIPTSFACYFILINMESPKLVHILLLGIVSCGIMFAFLASAENNRSLQDKSMVWIIAIERIIGLDNLPKTKVTNDNFNEIISKKLRIQVLFRYLFIFIILGWVVIFVGFELGIIKGEKRSFKVIGKYDKENFKAEGETNVKPNYKLNDKIKMSE